ncbi:right-handed parallel beta-helix repeat-containing protein, partial [Candidatus Woesearchaeota archaeon]|nr:right-handed parallel beta-helix repeat-containing protein [Candidatus Woesearchaeota archaeon]
MSKLDRTLDGIKHILLEDTRGLTIQELADQTKVSRVTAGMALMKMENYIIGKMTKKRGKKQDWLLISGLLLVFVFGLVGTIPHEDISFEKYSISDFSDKLSSIFMNGKEKITAAVVSEVVNTENTLTVVPDINPETIPETVPDTPQIIPEIMPEIAPIIIPEATPEIISENTSTLTSENTSSSEFGTAFVGGPEGGLEVQVDATSTSCGYVQGDLTLTANVTNRSTCFQINASNITLDCAQYKITYDTANNGRQNAINNSFGFHNITIKNCNIITTSTSAYSTAITFTGSQNATIINNNITITSSNFADGIYLSSNSTGANISNNFINKSEVGYSLQILSNNTFIFNNIINHLDLSEGIRILSARNIIKLNNITGTGGHGIKLSSAGFNNVSYNIINTTSSQGIYILSSGSQKNRIDHNIIETNGDYGIELSTGSQDSFIEENSIVTNATSAIYIGGSTTDNAVFLNNNISAPGEFTIENDAAATISVVYNSTFSTVNWTLADLDTKMELILGQTISVKNNSIYVYGDSNIMSLNSSAKLTFYNLPYSTTPHLLKDGVRCDNTNSCNISYDSSNFILYANVSSFSNYTTEESIDCRSLTTNTTMNKHLTSNSTCFTFAANNIFLDCANYQLNYTNNSSFLINGFNNDVIRNCYITESTQYNNSLSSPAITIINSNNTLIEDTNITTLNNLSYAVLLDGTSNNTILKNLNLTTNLTYTIFDNNTNLNTLIYNNSYGMINWTLNNLTTNISLSIGNTIYLDNNLIGLTSSNQTLNLNSSARISFYGLNYERTPFLLKDGARCDGTGLCNLTYNVGTGILSASINSFSNYSTQNSVVQCEVLNENLNLNQSLSSSTTCFIFNSSDLTLNCLGYTITYGTSGVGYGINITGFANSIIRNCQITEGISGTSSYGIYLDNVTNTLIEKTNITTLGPTSSGLYLNSTSNNTFNNLNISGNSYSIYFKSLSGNNTLIYNNSFGTINWTKNNLTTNISLSIGKTIFIEDNNVGLTDSDQALTLDNTAQIELKGLRYANQPHLLKDGVRCDDTSSCNISYSSGILSANISSFSNYSAQAIPSNCSYLNTDISIDQDLHSNGTCLIVNASNLNIDCNNNIINYSATRFGYGINVSAEFSNTSIINCNIKEFNAYNGSGIYLAGNNTIIEEVNITTSGASSYGIFLISSDSKIINTNITTNNTYAIFNNRTFNNSLYYSNNFGSINWTNNNLTTNISLAVGTTIFLENNKVGLTDNPQSLGLNGVSSLQIFNLSYSSTPHLFKNQSRCDNTDACNITYDSTNKILYANVSSFSNYSAVEAIICGTLNQDTTLNQNVSSTQTCFTINSSHLTLDCAGYTINYSTGSGDPGYAIYNSDGYDNITIKNCNIVEGGSVAYSHAIVYDNGATNANFFNNTFTIINSNWANGISLEASSTGANISNNFINKTGVGYHLYIDSSNINIVNNRLFGSGEGEGMRILSDNNIIEYNNLSGTYNTGIKLSSSAYNNVSYNIINITNGRAIYIISYDSQGNRLTHNIISTQGASSDFGIELTTNSQYSFIYENSIVTNGSVGINITGSSSNNQIIFNTNISSGGEYEIIDRGTTAGTHNLIYNTTLGLINWSVSNLTINITLQPGQDINISNGSLSVNNIVEARSLNGTANIEMKGLQWPAKPLLLKDGIRCDNSYICNTTYDSSTRTISASVNYFSNFSTSAINCSTPINESYHLSQPISSNGTCLTITANNTVLECYGQSITFNNDVNSGYGLNISGKSNITIKNCPIIESGSISSGRVLSIENVQNSTLENLDITTTLSETVGLILTGNSTNNTLKNINITSSGSYSLLDNTSSRNTLIYNSSNSTLTWARTNLTTNISLIDSTTIYVGYGIIGLTDNPERLNLDSPASIEFRDIALTTTPYLLKDGVRCDNQRICNISSFSGGILRAEVSGFSNYTLQGVTAETIVSTGGTTSSSVAVGGSAAPAAAVSEAAPVAPSITAPATGITASVSSSGSSLSFYNPYDYAVEGTLSYESVSSLSNEEALREKLKSLGLSEAEVTEKIRLTQISEEQGLGSALGLSYHIFPSATGIKPTGELASGKLLDELFPKEENIVIPAGGTYNKEFQIESALLAKPKRLMVTFSLEGKEVVEKEVVVESKKIIGSAVDIDTQTNTFDLYLAIPAREEEKTEYYWLELNINKALDSKVTLDNEVSKTEDDSITGLAVSNLEVSNLEESDATLFSELYGPYKIKSNEGILFGQEFSYSPNDYYGPVLMKTRVFKDGQTVLDNSFTVNLGPVPITTPSVTTKLSLAGKAVWHDLKLKTTEQYQSMGQ